MIRFVDLRSAAIPGIRFAYWDTIIDQFIEGVSGQGWGTWQDFFGDWPLKNNTNPIERFRALSPIWVDDELDVAERQGIPHERAAPHTA